MPQSAESNAPPVVSADVLHTWLVAHGFPTNDLNATIANCTTPLMHAARLGEHAIAAELLRRGAAVNAVNNNGNQALWQACFSADTAFIALLIENGADLNHQNDSGATCAVIQVRRFVGAVLPAIRPPLIAGKPAPTTTDDFTALDMASNLECLNLLRRAG